MRLVRQAVLAATLAAMSTTAVAETRPLVLAEGTPVSLKNSFRLTPREAKPGDRFEFKLADHLKVDGVVVVPAGTTGIGEILKSRGNRGFRRSGWVETRPLYVDYSGTRIEFATPEESDRVGDSQKKIARRQGSTTYYSSGATSSGVGIGTAAAVAGGLIVGTIVVLAMSRGPEGAIEADAPMVGHIRRDIAVAPAGSLAPATAPVVAVAPVKAAPVQPATGPAYTAI